MFICIKLQIWHYNLCGLWKKVIVEIKIYLNEWTHSAFFPLSVFIGCGAAGSPQVSVLPFAPKEEAQDKHTWKYLGHKKTTMEDNIRKEKYVCIWLGHSATQQELAQPSKSTALKFFQRKHSLFKVYSIFYGMSSIFQRRLQHYLLFYLLFQGLSTLP